MSNLARINYLHETRARAIKFFPKLTTPPFTKCNTVKRVLSQEKKEV